MSGHSKWHNIKFKKEKEDSKRGKIFTRLIREITVVVREGGGDINANARLRLLVEKAKIANMPKDNIERAIKKGTGELEGEALESIQYEGYGPHGIAVMVQALTDNKNRTVATLRHFFSKAGGRLADAGAVSWMFEYKAVLQVDAKGLTEDQLLEKLLEYNVDDIRMLDDGAAQIITTPKDLESVRAGAEKHGLRVVSAELQWVAKDPLSLEGQEGEDQVYSFLEKLEDIDDVQNVYTNVA